MGGASGAGFASTQAQTLARTPGGGCGAKLGAQREPIRHANEAGWTTDRLMGGESVWDETADRPARSTSRTVGTPQHHSLITITGKNKEIQGLKPASGTNPSSLQVVNNQCCKSTPSSLVIYH